MFFNKYKDLMTNHGETKLSDMSMFHILIHRSIICILSIIIRCICRRYGSWNLFNIWYITKVSLKNNNANIYVKGNNPFDVVKTKMQGTEAKQKYKNTLDCFVQVFSCERIIFRIILDVDFTK